MEPASANQKTNIIQFEPVNINRPHVYFEQNKGGKHFFLAHFNDCNHTLVTGEATLDDYYDIIDCHIEATRLDDYEHLKTKAQTLGISDLFDLSIALNDHEKYILSANRNQTTAILQINGQEIPLSIIDLLDEFLKEDDEKYMDDTDLMLDYICTTLSSAKRYKSKEVFQKIERLYQTKTLIKTEKIAG